MGVSLWLRMKSGQGELGVCALPDFPAAEPEPPFPPLREGSVQAQTPRIHLPNGLLHPKPHLSMEEIPKVWGLTQTLPAPQIFLDQGVRNPHFCLCGPPPPPNSPQIHLLNGLLHPKTLLMEGRPSKSRCLGGHLLT